MKVALLALAFPTCRAMPPAPNVSAPADPTAPARDTTTLTVVAGLVGASEGTGMGFAFRFERQVTEDTTVGIELTAGRGTERTRPDEPVTSDLEHDLFAVRGYGRYELVDGYVAATYGAGLSYFDTGMVTATVHGGVILGVTNDYVTPVLPLGLAIAVPVRTGRRFGLYDQTDPADRSPIGKWDRSPRFPQSEVYPLLGLGLIGNVASTGNYLSIDVALALGLRSADGIATITVSDTQRFEPKQ